MFESLEVSLTMDRALTQEEVAAVEKRSTAFLGGENRGYIELRKIPQTEKDYVFVLRLAS